MTLDERKHQLREHLTAARQTLLALLEPLPAADWERPVQTEDGGWTVKQVVLHIATSESGQLGTGKAIAAGQPTVPDDFDLNRYNVRQVQKNQDKSPAEILSGMAEARQKLLAFLDTVSADDLDKRGKHARGDVISLEQLFARIADHEAEHTATIQQALA